MDAAELQKQFEANANFDHPADVERAHRFILACRRILGSGIEEWQHGSERMRFNLKYIENEMRRAEEFAAANSTTLAPREVVFASMENFRA